LQAKLDSLGSYGYAWLVIWQEPWADSQSYFNSNGISPTNYFSDPNFSVLSQYSNTFGNGSGGVPQHYLLDKDGYVRKYSVGAIDGEPYATQWTNAIRELLGLPPI